MTEQLGQVHQGLKTQIKGKSRALVGRTVNADERVQVERDHGQ